MFWKSYENGSYFNAFLFSITVLLFSLRETNTESIPPRVNDRTGKETSNVDQIPVEEEEVGNGEVEETCHENEVNTTYRKKYRVKTVISLRLGTE